MRLGLKTILLILALSMFGERTLAQDANNYEDYFQSQTAKKAKQDWILNCQGCHKVDGTGRPEKGLPNLAGEVAKFLSVEGGREYLSRVPGVTNASVNDEDLAALINWLLIRFDPENISENHKPYTTAEVAKWRKQPLSLEAAQTRENLLVILNSKVSKN